MQCILVNCNVYEKKIIIIIRNENIIIYATFFNK